MKVKIPATSANLGPGFDCIGMSLNLYNYIYFEQTDNYEELIIDITGEGQDLLARDHNNLTYQAYKRVFDYLGEPIPGIKLNFENNIPLARGLGSSAAAVIGGLLIANYFLKDKLEEKNLLALAVEFEGHPDNVAPALLGGIVLSGNNEGEIIYKKIAPPRDLASMVIVPNYQLSTVKAREVLPTTVSYQDALFNVSRVSLLVDAFHTEDLDLLKIAMEDKLHQPYRSSLIPGFKEILQKVKELDLVGAAVSGAGPSILILHKKDKLDKIEQLQEILANKGIKSQLLFLEPTGTGACISE